MKAQVCLTLFALYSSAIADSITHGTTTVNMEFVDIGALGNPANLDVNFDGENPGSVSYGYRIGKYEVTIQQFMQAQTDDPNVGDGDEDYWDSGINSVHELGPDAPATMVSMVEAMKFCNWMTSGNAYTGAYNIVGVGPNIQEGHRANALSEFDVVYVLPTINEWYKAAYFDTVGTNGYSRYPSGAYQKPSEGVEANFGDSHTAWVVGSGIQEQNGTFDMGGNIREFSESPWREGEASSMGGHYDESSLAFRWEYNPSPALSFIGEGGGLGFRVVVLGNYKDSDVDKIYDGWEIEHFDSVEACNPNDDPDQDGYSNLEEFNNKTDPKVSDIYTLLWTSVEVGWKSQAGTNYQVQCSTNLESNSWENVGDVILGNGATNTVLNSTREAGQKFYRVIAVP